MVFLRRRMRTEPHGQDDARRRYGRARPRCPQGHASGRPEPRGLDETRPAGAPARQIAAGHVQNTPVRDGRRCRQPGTIRLVNAAWRPEQDPGGRLGTAESGGGPGHTPAWPPRRGRSSCAGSPRGLRRRRPRHSADNVVAIHAYPPGRYREQVSSSPSVSAGGRRPGVRLAPLRLRHRRRAETTATSSTSPTRPSRSGRKKRPIAVKKSRRLAAGTRPACNVS